ncbi:MAG: hypothetical protein IH956_07910 [Chloroflexi bacterium]|nr:hypothetical protein [Chloroflexota bacterium]
MIWFKSCPRCETGAVVLDKDFYGKHIQCLQCGYMKDLDDGYEFKGSQQRPEVKVAMSLEKETVAV